MPNDFANMSRRTGKPTICIGENKDADQLRGNREADQRLCFRYLDNTIPLLSKSKISSLYQSSVTVPVCVGPGRSVSRTGYMICASITVQYMELQYLRCSRCIF